MTLQHGVLDADRQKDILIEGDVRREVEGDDFCEPAPRLGLCVRCVLVSPGCVSVITCDAGECTCAGRCGASERMEHDVARGVSQVERWTSEYDHPTRRDQWPC